MSDDPLDPLNVDRYMIHCYEPGEIEDDSDLVPGEDAKSPHGDGVYLTDYEALWSRCQNAEAELGEANKGYGMGWLDGYEAAGTDDEGEYMAGRIRAAEALADAVEAFNTHMPDIEVRGKTDAAMDAFAEKGRALVAALSRFREPREIPVMEGTNEALDRLMAAGCEVVSRAATAAGVAKNRGVNTTTEGDENHE